MKICFEEILIILNDKNLFLIKNIFIIFGDNHNHLLKFPNNTLYMYKEFWLCKVEFTLMLLLEGFWGN